MDNGVTGQSGQSVLLMASVVLVPKKSIEPAVIHPL